MKNPVLLAFLVLPMVVMLGVLGLWQLDRLEEKTSLLDQRQERYAAAPIDLPRQDRLLVAGDWRRITATGTFDHNNEIHLYRPRRGENGYEVLTPLLPPPELAGLAPILVDRGWVPESRKDPSARAEGQLEGIVTVRGYVHNALDIRSEFTPENDPEQNQWYWVDYAAIGEHIDLFLRESVIVADATANPGGYPLGTDSLPEISNNHLQYAFTWFALAAALVVIWALLVVRDSRRPDGAPASQDV